MRLCISEQHGTPQRDQAQIGEEDRQIDDRLDAIGAEARRNVDATRNRSA